MAEETETLFKIPTPVIPEKKGRLAASDILGVQRPYLEEKSKIQQGITKATGEEAKAKQAQTELLAKETANVEQQAAQQERAAREGYVKAVEKEPLPAFVPTQDNARDMAGLFSLINVMGVLMGGSGKQDAIGALGAMNGMLEGYQKGRADLYKKERDLFDKNFKSMQQKHAELRREMEDAIKLAATDRQAGMAAAQLAAAKAGSSMLQAQLRRGELLGAYKLIEESQTGANKALDFVVKQKEAEAREANLERRHRESMAQRERLAQLKNEKTTTKQGQNALTFASRQYGNIANAVQDLKNMQMLPATAQSPVFAGMIGVDPNTALSSISALAARSITTKDQKAFEQITNSLDAALSRLEAQGLASGATKAAIQSFNSLKPRAGDSAINMALYIARVKQEIQTGIDVHSEMPGATQGQKDKAQTMLKEIENVVPFDVDTVLNVLRKDKKTLDNKMQNLLKVAPISMSIQMPKDLPSEVSSQQAAPAPTQPATSTVNIDQERSNAQAAIASGKDEQAVRARFKERTGQEL